MRYQDFVVQLTLIQADSLQIRVLKSPAGEGEITVRVPAWLPELAHADATGVFRRPRGRSSARLLRDLKRAQPAVPVESEVGVQLYDLLFSGVVGRLWDRSLGSLSDRRDTGLRLRLQVDLGYAEFLAQVPWELLRNGDTGQYLVLDRRTPVLRHLEVARPVQPRELPARLKVLGVASGPRDLASLDLATEKQRLQSRKRSRGWQVSFLQQPTVEELREAVVEQGAHVLHFMGHGEFDAETQEGALFFEDGEGEGASWKGSDLSEKLAGVPSLRLTVLNACETGLSGSAGGWGDAYGGVAAALVRGGMPAVIAMQRPIPDSAAISFSSAFYLHLARGGDLEGALTEGRQAIHTLDPSSLDWSIPVLFSRTTEDGLFVRSEAHRKGFWMVAAALVLLFGVAAATTWQIRNLPVTAIAAGRAEEKNQFSIEQVFATGIDGVTGRLLSVEILENGKMRLHFAFENRGKATRVVGFDFPSTYLADEFGNAYEVRASSSPVEGASSLTDTIPPGGQRRHWLEFPAPQDHARRLHVELASPERSEAKYVPFEAALPSYPKELSIPAPPLVPLPGAKSMPLAIAIGNGRRNVLSQIHKIEVAEKTMRLSLDLWNRGAVPIKAAFDPPKIELHDLQGNILRPVRMGTFEGGREKGLANDTTLRRSVRSRFFIDFPPPKTRSEKWELKLATKPNSEIRFASASLAVAGSIFDRARKAIEEFLRMAKPKLEGKPREDLPPAVLAPVEEKKIPPAPAMPEARFEAADGGQAMQTSQDGLHAKFLGIERLSNQRLRFVVALINVSSAPIEVPLRLEGTKLLDEQNRQFRLLASTFGEMGEGGPKDVGFTLAGGSARELVFEFSGREQNSELFTLLLGSSRPEQLRFKPIPARLPPD